MMEPTTSTLANWLVFSENTDVPVGLSREEARRRAMELRRLISEGIVSPEDVELTEEAKDVLWALAELTSEASRRPGDAVAAEAKATYHFVQRLDWPSDGFDEKRRILCLVASAGWGALGLTLEQVDARRSGGPSAIHQLSTDPTSTAEVLRRADLYLETDASERSSELISESFSHPDVLHAILQILRERADIAPSTTADEAISVYQLLLDFPETVGVFDERDHFLGTAALIASGACRLIGKREDADGWLNKADEYLRHTVNSAASLAEVGYARMSNLFDRRSYSRVLDMIPDLVRSFERFDMTRQALKTRLSEAVTLKELSRFDEALEKLTALHSTPALQQEPRLLAWISVYMAELLSGQGRYADAAECCEAAILLQAHEYQPLAMAHLKAVVGESRRNQGQLNEAADAYRAAIDEYLHAGVVTYAAYLRVVLSETLIALACYREAEREILAALPTIEEHKMVPEGFAAVALLKESVRRRKTDPNALRELREHLQANR